MSRDKRDKRGGHDWPGYDQECQGVKKETRRKRRRANKKYAEKWDDERFEPNPEKSTGGWITW